MVQACDSRVTVVPVTRYAYADLQIHPVDVIRRRMQVDVQRGKLRSGYQTARKVVASRGVRGLSAGFVPAALKIMPAVAVSLLVRDMLLGRVDTKHKAHRARATRTTAR